MIVYNVANADEVDKNNKWSEEEPSEITADELTKFEGEWAVVAYYTEPYEGSGQMIIKVGDALRLYNLGHCSCYGPLDEGFDDDPKTFDVFTVEEFLSGNIHKCSEYKSVNDKVRELLEA